MRLKIQTVPPLPVFKVWFTPGSEQCTTVANLKSALARDVLKQKNASPLELSLDGFDLLEGSLLQDVLRDGDLVVVKAADPSPGTRFFLLSLFLFQLVSSRQETKKEQQSYPSHNKDAFCSAPKSHFLVIVVFSVF
jgi:hypothetical protein